MPEAEPQSGPPEQTIGWFCVDGGQTRAFVLGQREPEENVIIGGIAAVCRESSGYWEWAVVCIHPREGSRLGISLSGTEPKKQMAMDKVMETLELYDEAVVSGGGR